MNSIFLSYAGLDRAIATQVARGLKGAGVDVWWDQEGIGWGDNWIHTLEDTLTKCRAYVILVGASGVRRWVKFELSLAIKQHIEQDLPIFPLLLPGVTPELLPPFLATLQAEPLPEQLSAIDYGSLAQRLSKRRAVQPASANAMVPSDVCPFPGLEAFGEKDAQFFFGRQKETLDAVSCLGLGLDGVYRRWLQVEGTSGVGKSSLVRAGLIPTVKKGWVDSTEAGMWRSWRVVEPMRPGADPILNLAEALSKSLDSGAGVPSVEECYGRLQGDEKAFQVGLRGWVPAGEALVLVIDQFEELFALTQDGHVRKRFDALLAHALADQDGPLHLVTTIRSDFMMQFASLPHLQPLLQGKAGRYLLNPIDVNGLRAVVRVPAELAGLCWSDKELPDEIVEEACDEPGALPLVGNLLRLLWLESRNTQSHTLSRQVYNDLGGVGGALAKSADALLEDMGAAKQNALSLLTALVNVGGQDKNLQDTRRTIPKSVALQAAGEGAQAEHILNQLSGLRGRDTSRGAPARPQLVVISTVTREGASTDLVDLAHETLLRYDRNKKPYWGTLRAEITKQRKAIEHRQLAEALAKEWREKGRSPWFGLATGAQCKAFRTLRDLYGDAAAYVAASQRVVNGLNGLRALIVCLLIPYLILAGWAQVKFNGLKTRLAFNVVVTQLGVDLLSPEMVVIKKGTYCMGDVTQMGVDLHPPDMNAIKAGKDCGKNVQQNEQVELPVHTVEIKSFELGKYEVTFDDYEPFLKIDGHNSGVISDEGWGYGQRPVINVKWEDIPKYIDWLYKRTGKKYRLPTEAEWEYAARSGGKDQIWAGTSDESQLKDYAVYGKRDGTEPVGSKTPNTFGLYDMSGNVWEWMEDCWHTDYKDAPNDGSAWLGESGGNCSLRVIRGGDWSKEPKDIQVSRRKSQALNISGRSRGFRLARDIDSQPLSR